jgi:hypothetical protein
MAAVMAATFLISVRFYPRGRLAIEPAEADAVTA